MKRKIQILWVGPNHKFGEFLKDLKRMAEEQAIKDLYQSITTK